MRIPVKNRFKGRTLLLATRHRKEQVIAPLMEKELDVRCIVPYDFDTDQFGTFSGEISRTISSIETLRKKCLAAHSLYNVDLVLASEGSFGAHPSSAFLTCNEEILMLKDFQNNWEIIERELSINTNSNRITTDSELELETFVVKAGFPEHGMIMSESTSNSITKGITDWHHLRETFSRYKKLAGSVRIETDMRALFNPTRMNVIASAAKKLVKRTLSNCPSCHTPGFGITEGIPGKPCMLCQQPTNSITAYRYCCQSCHFEEIRPKPGPLFEDPAYCDFCNP